MSRKKYRAKPRPTPTIDGEVESAYEALLAALSRADAQSRHEGTGGRGFAPAIDLSEAGKVLAEHPKLVQHLYQLKTREDARLAAQGTPDIALAAPTGSTPQATPLAAYWSGSKNEPVEVPNARVLRDLADRNPWVRAAINIRRLQVGRADIDVVPLNPLKPFSVRLQKRLRLLLNQPNEYRDTYRSIIEPVIEDILVLDRGVLTKSMTALRQPQALYYEDGATIGIYPGWDGSPNSYRYLYTEPGGVRKVPLRNDECIVFILNQASHRYGLSPVQVLLDTIQADLAAAKSGTRMVQMKPPPHVIHIQNATDGQIRNLRSTYEQDVAGQREILWLGGPPVDITPLVQSAKDNQWLEWQNYLMLKIAAVFQISPQQLGMTFDINKATGQVQQQIYEDTGFIPLLLLLEEQLNRELLGDFAPKLDLDRFDLDALNLRIVYPEVSESARQLHAEKAIDLAVKGLGGLPSMTLNQVLAMRGEQPVPGGNTFYYPSTTLGPVPWLSYEGGDTGDYTPPDLAGAQGSQDPAGGIADEDLPDAPEGESLVPLPVPQQAQPSAPGSAAPNPTKHLTLSSEQAQQTGIMVAFMLSAEEAQHLAQPGGEPANILHITLAYMGDTRDIRYGKDPIQDGCELKQTIARICNTTRPMKGVVGGVGRFTPAESPDSPIIALVDVPGLTDFRTRLAEAITSAGFAVADNHGYTPHITLMYIPADAPTPALSVPGIPLSLSTVSLMVGGNETTFPLGHPKHTAYDYTVLPTSKRIDTRHPGKRWMPYHLQEFSRVS